MPHVFHKFLASDLAEIIADATVTDGNGITSKRIQVWDVDAVMLEAYLTPESGADTAVTFTFQRSMDGVTWCDQSVTTIEITMTGTAQLREAVQLDVRGVHSLRLYSVFNDDAAKKATLVNALVSKTYGHIK